MNEHKNQPVDMVEIARRTTKQDVDRRRPGTVKVIAPAKVNLVLKVGPRRKDGYHDVQNIMQTVLLHDVLYMWPLDTLGEVNCECVSFEDLPEVDAAPEDNLAVRAVRALAVKLFGTAEKAPGVGIRIEKHVPAQAGLGGGSSDAAAALVGAAHLWQKMGVASASQVALEVLEEVGATLGADVPYFLRGGAGLYAGTGTQRVETFPSRKESVVIIQPEVGLSTKAVYEAYDEGAQVPALQDVALVAREFAQNQFLENDLQAPSVKLAPVIGDIIAWAAAQEGVTAVQMSGSGSAVFAICADFGIACKLAGTAKLQGWWARATAFGPAKAAVVPA